jgi:hypothetical protein
MIPASIRSAAIGNSARCAMITGFDRDRSSRRDVARDRMGAARRVSDRDLDRHA